MNKYTRNRRYVKDDVNVSRIAKFICDSAKNLMAFDGDGCYHYNLDGKFEIAIGWASGYGDKKRDDVIQSKKEPDYAIVTGLKKYNPSEYDFEWLDSAIIDGESYDTEISIDNTDLRNKCTNIAEYLIKEYKYVLEESNEMNDSINRRVTRR